MRQDFLLKLKAIPKNLYFWLFIVTGIAILIRSLPAWANAAWGCDFGIYYGITKSVAQSGSIFPTYSGWGSSYNYFPVLYSINAFASWITGIDILTIMPKLTPIFGGLTVLVFYFVANQLIDNKKIALLSTIFFCFMPFHVYQTSHASPLTMGHFFIMVSLYFFIRFRQNKKYFFPLLISTILLIMSHHLSTYFYLISLIGIVFVENVSVKKWTKTLKKDIFYIVATSLLIFSYWAFIATPVYESFMSSISIGATNIGAIFVIMLFYLGIACLFGLVKLIRKFNDYFESFREDIENSDKKSIIRLIWLLYPFLKKKWPSKRSRIFNFLLVLIVLLGAMLFFTTTEVPWVGFSFNELSIIYSLPLIVALAFGAAGFRYTWYIKNGLFIRGWTLTIALSFVIMLLANNTLIYPHRHVEYAMAPLAILIVYGIGGIFSDPFYKGLLSRLKDKKDIFVRQAFNKIKITQKNRIIQLTVILILIVSLASTTYAVHKSLDASDERITSENINAIKWITENLDKNVSIIASDHRLARMAESEGFNTTKDETYEIWEAEELDEYIDELYGIEKNHSKITHIIIDDIMKNDVVHVHFGSIKYMTNETWTAAYDKFQLQPFNLIYRNESIDINPETLEPIHWTEIYEVNWTYLKETFPNPGFL